MIRFRFFPATVRVRTVRIGHVGDVHVTDAEAIRDLNEILGTSRYQVQALEGSQFVVAGTASRMIHSNTPTSPPATSPQKPRRKPRKR